MPTTTSADLGNMVSMAVASPFLPLAAAQILLDNFLSDVPAVGLADDGVDPTVLYAGAAELAEKGSLAHAT